MSICPGLERGKPCSLRWKGQVFFRWRRKQFYFLWLTWRKERGQKSGRVYLRREQLTRAGASARATSLFPSALAKAGALRTRRREQSWVADHPFDGDLRRRRWYRSWRLWCTGRGAWLWWGWWRWWRSRSGWCTSPCSPGSPVPTPSPQPASASTMRTSFSGPRTASASTPGSSSTPPRNQVDSATYLIFLGFFFTIFFSSFVGLRWIPFGIARFLLDNCRWLWILCFFFPSRKRKRLGFCEVSGTDLEQRLRLLGRAFLVSFAPCDKQLSLCVLS